MYNGAMGTNPTQMPWADTAEICRGIRNRLRLTQVEFGHMLARCPQSMVSRYEKGLARPGARRLYQLFAIADRNEREALAEILRKLGLPVHDISIGQPAGEVHV